MCFIGGGAFKVAGFIVDGGNYKVELTINLKSEEVKNESVHE